LKEPVRILSDLHLGHRVSRIDEVESLRPLLVGAGTVVFNGDTWQELARRQLAESREKLEALKKICREEGCEPVFLPGNHDPGWPGKGYLELAGGKIVVTHGDALFYDGSPWKREILTNRDHIAAIWARHPTADSNIRERLLVTREIARELPSLTMTTGRRLWQRAWDGLTPPLRGFEMLKAWFTQGKAGAEFCDRYFPAAEFLIIGHLHWGGCWKVSKRRTINTGSFLNPSRAYWVDYESGQLTRGVVDETPDGCRKGKVLDRWRF
jgi:UDP-2,3-diacylglucosamine pyrophosphatase LpxH